jgi:peptidoglycan/LPS O-acetylase OafA/YrhL
LSVAAAGLSFDRVNLVIFSERLASPDSSAAQPSFGSRIAGLEGLRGLAALGVVVFHVWYFASPNRERGGLGPLDLVIPDLVFGVTLFFALSGFLLYRPYVASLLRGTPLPSVRKYFRNRALRIFPAYWVILLVSALVLQSVLVREGNRLYSGSGADAGLLLQSALLIQNFRSSTLGIGIGPAWFLAVEMVFYLVLPLLAVSVWAIAHGRATRSARRFAALVPPVALLLLGLSGKATAAFLVTPAHPYASWNADWHSVIVRSFWGQADLFAFGMALAIVRIDWEDGLLDLPRWWRKVAFGGALAGYVVTAKETYLYEQLTYSPYNTLMAAACGLLLALIVLPSRDAVRLPLLVRALEARILVGLGVISYSLYLWHEPLARFLEAHGWTFAGPGGFFVNIALVLAVAVPLSLVTHRFVEVPALRLRSRGAIVERSPELPAER